MSYKKFEIQGQLNNVKSKSMNLNTPSSIKKFLTCLFFALLMSACTAQETNQSEGNELKLGNERFAALKEDWKGKQIGFVGNHTSLIGQTHFVDTLLTEGFTIKKLFSPEHGFRGEGDAGEKINNSIDEKTGLPILSLYGKNKKPSAHQLEGIDVLFFDIQDVGVRYYTYTSTLHYIMQAAAEQQIPLIVFDRPNPNGHYVDGPVLDLEFSSFVGLHPVPIVHGMTIGEYARMINEEGWLGNELKADLTIIECLNYDRQKMFEITVPPSPNLPNMRSILLYPVLCLFEGTPVSVGRGTDGPFQQYGHPFFVDKSHSFTPKPTFGAKNPKLNGIKCFGETYMDQKPEDLFKTNRLDLSLFIEAYNIYPEKSTFFTNFFNLLAGNDILQNQIKEGVPMSEIRKSWQEKLIDFKSQRKKYLLY